MAIVYLNLASGVLVTPQICVELFLIALDSYGYPHMSYIDTDHSKLKYAYYDGITWYTETVSDAQVCGTSLALDSGDDPHIGYVLDSGLMYALNRDIGWQVQNSHIPLGNKKYVLLRMWISKISHIWFSTIKITILVTQCMMILDGLLVL